jgi:hypothetical protein
MGTLTRPTDTIMGSAQEMIRHAVRVDRRATRSMLVVWRTRRAVMDAPQTTLGTIGLALGGRPPLGAGPFHY